MDSHSTLSSLTLTRIASFSHLFTFPFFWKDFLSNCPSCFLSESLDIWYHLSEAGYFHGYIFVICQFSPYVCGFQWVISDNLWPQNICHVWTFLRSSYEDCHKTGNISSSSSSILRILHIPGTIHYLPYVQFRFPSTYVGHDESGQCMVSLFAQII